jgi:hypothetical protein
MKILSPLLNYFATTGKMKSVGAIEGEFSKTIVLPITNITPSQVLYFRSDNELSDSIIRSVECVVSTNLGVVSFNGTLFDNISDTQAAGGIFVLSNSRREILATLPLYSLIRSINQGKASFSCFKDIIWESCYVYFPSPVATADTYAVTLRVYFDKKI